MAKGWFISCTKEEIEKIKKYLSSFVETTEEVESVESFFKEEKSLCYVFVGEGVWNIDKSQKLLSNIKKGGSICWLVCTEENKDKALKTALELNAYIVNLDDLDRFLLDLKVTQESREQGAKLKELAMLDRLCTLGSMAAGIAHEINNPLAFIQASIQTMSIYVREIMEFISERFDEAELYSVSPRLGKSLGSLPAAIERVNFGIARIARISKTLRDFAANSEPKKEECSLNEIVQAAVLLAEPKTKYAAKVKVELSSSLPNVFVNAQEIEQVVLNLLINASHALEGREDGVIKISAKRRSNGFLILSVEDNGPGIKPTDIEAIFKPFYTTKEKGKGTGLGLAICRDIVKKHGGTIKVKKSSLGGACFEVALPVAKAEEVKKRKQACK